MNRKVMHLANCFSIVPHTGRFAPFFLLYKTYTSNHPNAENTLDRLKQHEGVCASPVML